MFSPRCTIIVQDREGPPWGQQEGYEVAVTIRSIARAKEPESYVRISTMTSLHGTNE